MIRNKAGRKNRIQQTSRSRKHGLGHCTRILLACVLCVCLFGCLPGCVSVRTQIAYSIYPIGWLVSALAQNTVTTVSLQDGQTAQRAQIQSNYQDILAKSAVFMHIGDLEPYLSVYQNEIASSGTPVLDLSAHNAVYDFARYTPDDSSNASDYQESAWYDSALFDQTDMYEKDVSLWNDPVLMLSMAKDILSWLEKTYPENTDLYETNFKKLEADLVDLDAQYQALATQAADQSITLRFVTVTPSFGNWQKTYGFQVYPLVLSRYGVLPDEEELAVMEQRIKTDGVQYIVYEDSMPDDMKSLFNRVMNDCGLTRIDLSNLSSLTPQQEEDGKDYLSIMYENLAVLQSIVEQKDQAG